MGAQCNKVRIFATGEVLFLDIGLLMGAKFFNVLLMEIY
jgi:hypothetical protein